ncbi:MAG: response regulator [Acidimicrobiales bacterium]|nr:response regulator [Acidimicrobiales bacterium]
MARSAKTRDHIRVLIVDDHAMFAESVARLVQTDGDIEVVGIAATSADALRLAIELRPDVAIVDYQLPDADGTTTAEDLRASSPETMIVLLTGMPDAGVVAAAVQAGCSGFLTKDNAGADLIRAVRMVHSGQAFIPSNHLSNLHRGLAIEKLKSEFLARISHELRTPLAGILGYAKLLAHGGAYTERASDLANEIVQSGERLQRVIEILEFTASTAVGEFHVLPKELPVERLIDHVLAKWHDRLDAAHPLNVELHGAPLRVMADAHWVVRALDELVDNAVKFSPEGGGVTLDVQLVEVDGQPMIEFAVVDHGRAMSPAEQAVAFEEFLQLDPSDTREYGGLGLGLALVRRVALAHGGAVHYEAVEPSGSRISIDLPAVA